jgi:predicted AlkP superfamily phosphohydrolase/phosphomutase
MSTERYALQRKHEFRATRDEVVKVARRVSDLCVELIRGEPWDLFFASFASVHRGGHRLWALHNIVDSLSAEDRIELADALHLVYEACDQVVGRLLDAAGPDVTVMVFSLHGMGPNSSKTILLPEMLRRVVEDVSTDAVRSDSGLLRRLREILPGEFRHRVKSALPVRIRHWLTAFWRMKEMDWSRTRAFSLIADTQGWIRINLKGREALGIVEPGEEYDRLCARIANGLRTFVDADTGQAIINNIVRSNQVFEGERSDQLPDMIVQWSELPAARLRAVVSPRFGKIDWPTPGQNPEGRSGNHRPEGMLIAAGEGVKSGTINGAHILDLAPTILTMLGFPIPPDMEGKALFQS